MNSFSYPLFVGIEWKMVGFQYSSNLIVVGVEVDVLVKLVELVPHLATLGAVVDATHTLMTQVHTLMLTHNDYVQIMHF